MSSYTYTVLPVLACIVIVGAHGWKLKQEWKLPHADRKCEACIIAAYALFGWYYVQHSLHLLQAASMA